MRHWLDSISPDLGRTLARFPLAVLFSLLSTILFIALINEWFGGDDIEPVSRLAAGLSAGAVYAVAGVLFGEARSKRGAGYILLAFGVPLLVVGAFQISDMGWIVSPMLLPLAFLWLSLSAFTPWADRFAPGERQDRFWWLNHRAITTAVIAAVAFGLICVGIIAVERALAVLFGLETGKLFYEYLLPFTGLFLVPVYWLSTLPELTDFTPQEMSRPDFLSRAIGFLGQFVLTPFLFLYALILLAYAVQIAVTRELPQGMLGWMVLGFVVVGAANWLVLHPPFMHDRALVRHFRRFWFWLTLAPLALYWLAVFVRIDVYGLTPERVGLVAAGIWALVLALAFLSRRFADIRLIPGLALVIIAFFSVGPWNFVNLPRINQAARLDAAVYNAMSGTQSMGGPYEWTEPAARTARGAITFLTSYAGDRERLAEVLGRHGLDVRADDIERRAVLEELGLQNDVSRSSVQQDRALFAPETHVFDASETPFVLNDINLRAQIVDHSGALKFQLAPGGILVNGGEADEELVSLAPWLERQEGDLLSDPVIEFRVGGARFRLVAQLVEFRSFSQTGQPPEILRFRGRLYSERLPRTDAEN